MLRIVALAWFIFILLWGVSFVTSEKSIHQNANKEVLLWSNSFDSQDWMDQWYIRENGKVYLGNIEIAKDSDNIFANILRVHYKKGSLNPSRKDRPTGGTNFHARLDFIPSDSLYLRYYVRFADDFPFNKGGKLPGLFGGKVHSGGHIPDGTNGFSTRFMWREGGKGEVYAYLPTSVDHGTSFGAGNWSFVPGIWYELEQHVVLNTIGKKDGSIEVWVDGKPILKKENLYFRSVDTLKIQGIFFSTFFGGHDSSWAAPKDTYIDFANFAISAIYINPKALRE